MTTEEAIREAEEFLAEELDLASVEDISEIHACDCGREDWEWDQIARSAAHHARRYLILRHLISEARKVERVRAKYATLNHQESVECPDAGELWAEGFEEAWDDVMLIVGADNAEREK